MSNFHRIWLAAALTACEGAPQVASPVVAPPPKPEPVTIAPGPVNTYTLRLPRPQTHYLEVEASFPAGGEDLELVMASWTPGSYLIRDFARHLEGFAAFGPDGAPLPAEKIAKNRWRVTAGGAAAVGVRYRLWCRELSVRTNWLDDGLLVLNGAATFLAPEGSDRPYDVTLELPDRWTDAAVALPAHPGGGRRWLAPDYDALVDAPMVAGALTRYPFEIGGTPLELVLAGQPAEWDGPRSAADVETLSRTIIDFWGGAPFERYLFLNLIDRGGGGLEHRASTLMISGPWRTRERGAYLGWLGLVSHEFFHTWNVKRLRPEGLGPFDYEREVYTPSLWIAEGITSYYDDLLLVRAGLMTEEEYLGRLSEQIRRVQSAPGRGVRSLSEASLDAWIKHYQPDANNSNTTVSYYRKGAVVAFLLDAEIRRLTGGARSLDDVMRLAYSRFSGERGFAPAEFRAAASEVAGQDLAPWFAAAVDGPGELSYAGALAWWGLRFAAPPEPPEPIPGWLGAEVETREGRSVIKRLRRGTPAYEAGLDLDDEVIAVEGWRVSSGGPDELVGRYRPGDEVALTVARRGALRQIPVTLGQPPRESWTLEIDPDAPGAAAERARWLAIPPAEVP